MAWSLTDNYEWQHAYTKKFGLIAVDPITMERTLKKSGRWYKEVIEMNGF
jgi:beta-glucosidase